MLSQQQLIDIAKAEIEAEGFSEYKISKINYNEEYSNRNSTEYIGEIYYNDEEDGEPVSSVFVIVEYGNGTTKFDWS